MAFLPQIENLKNIQKNEVAEDAKFSNSPLVGKSGQSQNPKLRFLMLTSEIA